MVFPKVGRPLIQTITTEEFEKLLLACAPPDETGPFAERAAIRNRAILQIQKVARTSQIIRRWVRAQYVVYRHIYAKQPGWIYLTKTGLYHADLPYRAEPPRDRLLGHISAINEVRLKLDQENPMLQWIGERAIQAAHKKHQRGQRLEHIPDGMIVSGSEHIDVEVQLSRPAETKVALVMRGRLGSSNMNPLRYYASASAIAVIRKVYREVMKGGWQGRPRIEIVEVERFLEPSAGESAP